MFGLFSYLFGNTTGCVKTQPNIRIPTKRVQEVTNPVPTSRRANKRVNKRVKANAGNQTPANSPSQSVPNPVATVVNPIKTVCNYGIHCYGFKRGVCPFIHNAPNTDATPSVSNTDSNSIDHPPPQHGRGRGRGGRGYGRGRAQAQPPVLNHDSAIPVNGAHDAPISNNSTPPAQAAVGNNNHNPNCKGDADGCNNWDCRSSLAP